MHRRLLGRIRYALAVAVISCQAVSAAALAWGMFKNVQAITEPGTALGGDE